MALKLIFMGTPEFAVPILKKIYESKHKVLSVFTQTPKKSKRGQKVNISPVHQLANKLDINIKYPENLNDENEYKFIQNLNPDVVVVVAYGKMIPTKILSIQNIKFINIHASILPRWRGAAPIQRAIIDMDSETGVSIMKIVPELDAGPYMLQKKIKIEKEDNYSTLSYKLSMLGSELILKSLKLIEEKKYRFINQDEKKVTYAKKIDKLESKINWDMPSKNIIAKINGLTPNPGVWFTHKNSRLKIIKAVEVNQNGETGKILDDNLTIACKVKAIKILLIQKEGKKILSSKEFLAGHKIEKGEKLT